MTTKTSDAENIAMLDANDAQVRQDFVVAERVSWFFINHGHIECSVVVDAFYERGMEGMLSAALDNGAEILDLCQQAFHAAGASLIFNGAKMAQHTMKFVAAQSSKTMRAMRDRRDQAISDLSKLTGTAREAFVHLQFAGKEPSQQDMEAALERVQQKLVVKPKLRPTIVFPVKPTIEQPKRKRA